MKDKKAEQITAKSKHKEALKLKRKQEPDYQRSVPTRIEKPTILIVCEGENTEPSYFSQYRLSSATIKAVGAGYNTVSLVNKTLEIAAERKYEQVWCVFDKDSFNDNEFNEAIQIAEANSFNLAYSNQAFEYWIILHFDDHQGGGMNRKDYNKKINSLLKPYNMTYDGEKSKLITREMFELMDGIDERTNKRRKTLAINRAKRNYNLFDHTNPAAEESSTTVFKLVEELLKYV